MPGFFLRPVDLGSLTLLFVAVLIGWRLLLLRPRTDAVRNLIGFYISVVVLIGLWLLAATRLDDWHYYAVYSWRIVWFLAFVFLIQYTYCAVELDSKGSEARQALWISLAGLAIVIGWAIYRIVQFSASGEPIANFLLPETLNVLGALWALLVVSRQAYRNWQVSHSFSLITPQIGLIVGLFLLFLTGVSAIADQIFASRGVLDFVRIFLVAIAINIVGFNFLVYQDTLNSRVNRVIAAALLLLQTVFTFLGFYMTAQFQLVNPDFAPELNPSTPLLSLTAGEILRRQNMHTWTLPIFAFQALVTVLAIVMMMLAGSRIRALDRYFNNLALSDRQNEIISLVADGLNNQEIALRLLISENTVKYHLKAIYEALNLPDRNSLALWYRQRTGSN